MALRSLSTRPRSVEEIRRRLHDRGFSPEDTGAAVTALTEAGYLDDERFASLLASSRVKNKHWGPARIAADLRAKGVGNEAIKQAICAIGADEELRTAFAALSKFLKKNSLKPPLDAKARLKACRHLAARGFSAGAISAAMKAGKEPGE